MKKILVIILCTIPVFCILADNWQGQQGCRRFYLETDYTAPGTALTLPEFWIERAACDSMSLSGDSLDLRFNRGQIVFKGCFASSRQQIDAVVSLYGKSYDLETILLLSSISLFFSNLQIYFMAIGNGFVTCYLLHLASN